MSFTLHTSKSPTHHSRLKSLLSQRTDLAIIDQEFTISQTDQSYQESITRHPICLIALKDYGNLLGSEYLSLVPPSLTKNWPMYNSLSSRHIRLMGGDGRLQGAVISNSTNLKNKHENKNPDIIK